MAQTPHEAQVGHRNVRILPKSHAVPLVCCLGRDGNPQERTRELLTAATLHEISVTAEAPTLVDRSEAACDESQTLKR